MDIDVNEVLNTDVFREVFVQYNEEQKRLRHVRRAFNNTNTDTSNYPYKIVAGSGIGSVHNMNHTHTTPYTSVTHYAPYKYTNRINSQVCFLVRTSTMHDRIQYVDKGAHFVESTVYDFITSLQKQTNPNWRAYLFLTDNRPFGDKLKSIALGAEDSRVVYYEVDSAYRPAFTKVDGGYTATDHVLHHTLRSDPTCKYITVTNADNWYGSEVVQGVLGYGGSGGSGGSGGGRGGGGGGSTSGRGGTGGGSGGKGGAGSGEAPPMLLAPLDSRNFNIDYYTRGPNRATHDEGCRAFNSLLQQSSLVYTVQPLPRVSKIDLASMFLNRERLLAENVLFANFTDPLTYPCLGCQDGYLAEYLSKTQGWGHGRMAIDGLKSVVFHGPSPTLCVAMGNVWFDHPAVNKVGCYPRPTAHSLRLKDLALHTPQYDWANFDSSLGVCLRLSSAAFSRLDKQDVLIVGKKVNKRGQSLLNLLNWT